MILLILLFIPLAAAGLSALSDNAKTGASITLLSALFIFAFSTQTALKVILSPDHAVTAIPHWIVLDGLGALIILLVSFVSLTAALFSMGYMNFTNGGSRRYHTNLNLFIFSLLIVPLMQEPNGVWISVELTTLFSVLLVGFENTHDALEAAWKYTVLTLMGAAIALLGFIVLYWAAHTAGVEYYTWNSLTAAAPRMSPVLMKGAFILILVGFGAKIGLVPLHTWLPDAHSQAPTPVCALLSGVETTVVLYILLRLLPIVTAVPAIHAETWLVVFGLISVGTAAFLLLRVRDYKRLFAFSTVEHMGIILTAVGLGGVSAHFGGILQIIGHTVTKSFCFYAAGSVLLLTGTRDISSIRGIIHKSPGTGAALFFGGLAISGAPPFVLFLSEFSIIKAGFHLKEYLVSGLLLLFITIAFFAIMNHISRMVFGSDTENTNSIYKPLPISIKITLTGAVIPVVILGIYVPGVLQKLITLAGASLGG